MIPPRVDGRRDQVMRRGDCMKIAGEVKIEILHWDNLTVAATRSPPLDPKARPHTGLANATDCVFAQLAKTLGETHGGRGFSFSKRRRRNGSYVNVFALRLVG